MSEPSVERSRLVELETQLAQLRRRVGDLASESDARADRMGTRAFALIPAVLSMVALCLPVVHFLTSVEVSDDAYKTVLEPVTALGAAFDRGVDSGWARAVLLALVVVSVGSAIASLSIVAGGGGRGLRTGTMILGPAEVVLTVLVTFADLDDGVRTGSLVMFVLAGVFTIVAGSTAPSDGH